MRALFSTLIVPLAMSLAWPAIAADVLCPGVSTAPPPAPDHAAARIAFEASEEAYRVGRLRKSLRHACQAQELAPDKPDLVFNVAQIYRNLGECRLATVAYQAYVERGKDAETLETARSYIAQLDECAPTQGPEAETARTEPDVKPVPVRQAASAAPPAPPPAELGDSTGISAWTYGMGATALVSAAVAAVSAFRLIAERKKFNGAETIAEEDSARRRGKTAEAMTWGFGAAAVLLGGGAVLIELSSDSTSQQVRVRALPNSVTARYELQF